MTFDAVPGEPDPSVSVIIPMFNAAPVIVTQLEALARQQTDVVFEVIVVDDRSTDNGAAIVRSFATEHYSVRLVPGEGRGSYAARNTGVAAARGALLLFCDADDRADPHWVSSMGLALENNSIVAGPTPLDALNSTTVRHWRSDEHLSEPRRFGELTVGTTANLGIRKDLFESVGGFRSDVRHGDDIGICCRAHRLGHSVAHQVNAIMQYRARPGLIPHIRQCVQYGRAMHRLGVDYGDGTAAGASPVRLLGSLLLNSGQSAAAMVVRDRSALGLHCGNAAFAWGALIAWSTAQPPAPVSRHTTLINAPFETWSEVRRWRQRVRDRNRH